MGMTSKEWYDSKGPEYRKEINKRRTESGKDKEYKRKYAEDRPGWAAESSKKFRASKEDIAQYGANWRKNNPVSYMLHRSKHSAKRRDLEHTITVDDIVIPDICPLLGIPLVWNAGQRKGRSALNNSPSLDRLDNTKGYIPGNVWVISYLANRMKSNATDEHLNSFCINWLRLQMKD